jgi:hypothetical protein
VAPLLKKLINPMKTTLLKRIAYRATIAASLLFFVSCDGGLLPEANVPIKPGTLNTTIKEEGFFGASNASAVVKTDRINIKATTTGVKGEEHVIDITVPVNAAVPYSVTIGTDANAFIGYTNEETSPAKVFLADKDGGSGTVTITELTPTIKGTFNATLPIFSGGTGEVRTLTGGEFNANR